VRARCRDGLDKYSSRIAGAGDCRVRRAANSTGRRESCQPLYVGRWCRVCWGEDFPAFAAPTRKFGKETRMGRHSMNYQPETNQGPAMDFRPDASVAPPGDPIQPGVPGAPGAPSPDGPSTVPGDPAQPAEPTQPSEPSWPVGPDGPEVPTGPAEPEPSHPVEPPPVAPEEFDDGSSAARGLWHAAGEEALR
jgi:hypothetical protein